MRIFITLIILVFFGNAQAHPSIHKDRFVSVDTTEKQYIPKNMKDCLKQLDRILHDSVKTEIHSLSKKDFLNNTHFGLGMWLRNNWGLWDSNSKLYRYFIKCRGRIYQPDFMSEDILSFYYDHLVGDKNIKVKIRKYERGKKWYD